MERIFSKLPLPSTEKLCLGQAGCPGGLPPSFGNRPSQVIAPVSLQELGFSELLRRTEQPVVFWKRRKDKGSWTFGVMKLRSLHSPKEASPDLVGRVGGGGEPVQVV